ncbi:molecular chaperone DnaJ [Nocardioides soli]|uniref:Molecular chaperone DnaJ n=1 Tax=Nocardioides soli TaxID=1036020 RepID=A0A7W4VSY6_9ACTN|nr:molecular chaperone DnaJ [Nocardioides soli]MBB3041186.1 hypothetical protein [Nocardioides soli]
MRYTTRPLSDRTWFNTSRRSRSQFTSTWADTLTLLEREIEHLKGRELVIEVDVREQDIRLDGMLRASAVASDPAVVLAMESKHGPLLYRCDRYNALPYRRSTERGEVAPKVWMHNVRAIALTLEALRAVDRYGATETGQQYAGFKALPAGRAIPASHMTSDEAWSIIGSYQLEPVAKFRAEACTDEVRAAYRRARAAAHPDRHRGDRTLWDQVEQAAAVLGVAR